jgi:hypothetical protein
MLLRGVYKAVAMAFILAMAASLVLGCASSDSGKATKAKAGDAQPVSSTEAAGKGLYPENRDKGAIKELEREQQKKQ